MSITKNNDANVSSTKGVKGGYYFSMPRTAHNVAAIPKLREMSRKVADILEADFEDVENLGYISDSGYVNSINRSTNDTVDLNGDVVDTTTSSRVETANVTLMEVKRSALAEQYGHGNVTDEDGLITVLHNGDEGDNRIYVAALLLKNGRQWREVITNGRTTAVGDLTALSSTLAARQITTTCFVDEDGNSVIDYIESTETGSAAPGTGTSPEIGG